MKIKMKTCTKQALNDLKKIKNSNSRFFPCS